MCVAEGLEVDAAAVVCDEKLVATVLVDQSLFFNQHISGGA